VNDWLTILFSLVCGRDPDHLWAPGELALPFCQRCTGLYVGVFCALLLHVVLRSADSARLRWLHLALLLQMAPFGFHWVPQGPLLRTLSGGLFAFGLVGCLWLLPAARWGHKLDVSVWCPPFRVFRASPDTLKGGHRTWRLMARYGLGLILSQLGMLALACWGGRAGGLLLAGLAVAGLLTLVSLAVLNLALLGAGCWTGFEVRTRRAPDRLGAEGPELE
jgi:hypothetical protein